MYNMSVIWVNTVRYIIRQPRESPGCTFGTRHRLGQGCMEDWQLPMQLIFLVHDFKGELDAIEIGISVITEVAWTRLTDWLIDFKGISTHLGLFHT